MSYIYMFSPLFHFKLIQKKGVFFVLFCFLTTYFSERIVFTSVLQRHVFRKVHILFITLMTNVQLNIHSFYNLFKHLLPAACKLLLTS